MIDSIYIAGHKGMVGSAIVKHLRNQNSHQIITQPHSKLDLLEKKGLVDLFKNFSISKVYIAAAKVGGIYANNTYPADFIYQNLMIQSNIINAAHEADINNLLFLGSSCIYPKFAEQPMKEESLLTGPIEPTNEPYAIAKIAGIKMCESYNRQYGRDYRSVMPTNLFGPNDNFHLNNSHVIPALIHRFHEAKIKGEKEVIVWGTGKSRREFLHVDDMAEGCTFVMGLTKKEISRVCEPQLSHINLGTGEDHTIAELAEMIKGIVDFPGKIIYDKNRPEGPPRKLLDVSKIHSLGWKHRISLEEGLRQTYKWLQENQQSYRSV